VVYADFTYRFKPFVWAVGSAKGPRSCAWILDAACHTGNMLSHDAKKASIKCTNAWRSRCQRATPRPCHFIPLAGGDKWRSLQEL